MFDISLGEFIVMTGLSLALVGRKDLPKASKFVGMQVGRAVGFLQGARVRADRYTAQNELRQLQNELRAGLRELDAVRSEIAVAASTSGVVGRDLGATVGAANRQVSTGGTAVPATQNVPSFSSVPKDPVGSKLSSTPNAGSAFTATSAGVGATSNIAGSPSLGRSLAPRSQAVAAIAEEEWVNQGIGFKSRAESSEEPSGSKLLANLLTQTLIHDQYDRTVQEQNEALESKADQIERRIKSERDRNGGKNIR